jgi:LemA protein
MKKSTWIIIAVVAVVALYGFSTYNKLVSMNGKINTQWSQVETQYQRRFDLIPNLVNAVEGTMRQEEDIFLGIAEARSKYAGAGTPEERAAAANQVEGALGRLLVVMENYPQLGSSQNVANLMNQLEGAENRIATERGRYNESVGAYNIAVKRFPTNMFAGVFGFDSRTFFESAEGAENAPKVNIE